MFISCQVFFSPKFFSIFFGANFVFLTFFSSHFFLIIFSIHEQSWLLLISRFTIMLTVAGYIYFPHIFRLSPYTFLDGYCSTVQGLLDWFEVDLGFTELLFIQIGLCVMCVLVLYSPVSLSSCPFWRFSRHVLRTRKIYVAHTWLIHVCDMTDSCMKTWQICVRDMTRDTCVV